MRRALYFAGLVLVVGLMASVTVLCLTRATRPVIMCFSPDDNVRPRTRCILNPFRDRSREEKAEAVLLRLREGDISVLTPVFANLNPDSRNHLVQNETKYRVRSWRIGRWSDEDSNFSLMYWVKRENYEDWEEEVTFHFELMSDGWHLIGYSAIY